MAKQVGTKIAKDCCNRLYFQLIQQPVSHSLLYSLIMKHFAEAVLCARSLAAPGRNCPSASPSYATSYILQQ